MSSSRPGATGFGPRAFDLGDTEHDEPANVAALGTIEGIRP